MATGTGAGKRAYNPPSTVRAMIMEDAEVAPSPTTWASLAYLVIGCTVAGFMLYNWGLEDLEPSTATSLSNLIPVFGLILAALILHEQINVQQLVGGAIVIVGIILSTREDDARA